MTTVRLELEDNDRGSFVLYEDDKVLGEMRIGITDIRELTVYHTEIKPEYEGKGYSKLLLNAMVDHARSRGMKVIPLCPYVLVQFKRHPELYSDIWLKQEVKNS